MERTSAVTADYRRPEAPARLPLGLPVVLQMVRSRAASAAALAVVAASLLLPPDGLGIPLCGFLATTRLPCVGCGLTRSFIALAHLDFPRAAAFHPFAFVLLPLAFILALLLPLPVPSRERLAARMLARRGWLTAATWLVVGSFLLFGAGRLGYCAWLLWQGRPLPVAW
ncbi:MAG: DUF2752 domain-containing protein [Armatimonadota bacterium]